MPGRLRSSFRSGNLAEHLGLLLLKGLAAVAEVARQEDVGLDAIATLLRLGDDGNCYAEDSFLVQLKSASTQQLEYRDHELDWLISQTQPMFIGLVSLERSEISLYPTIFVNQAVASLNRRKVTIQFGTSDLPPFFEGRDWTAWRGERDHSVSVWLGDPLLQWTLSDLGDKDWATNAYSMLKSFLAIVNRELELLSLGQFSVLDWLTNDATSIRSQYGLAKGHADNLESLAERCAPNLHAIMLSAWGLEGEVGNDLMTSLVALAAALKKAGVEIDPHDFFGKFFFALERGRPE